jgi:hypothetical protein
MISQRELQELFMVEATKYNVSPLDNSVLARVVTPRPSATAGQNVFTYSSVMSGLPHSDAPSILNRSYTITADVEIPESRPLGLSAGGTAEGMLVTMGGRLGVYGLYLLNVSPGKHTITLGLPV